MADLRNLSQELARRGDIVTPPVTHVARRARRTRTRRAGAALVLGLVLVLVAPTVVEWVTDGDESSYIRMMNRPTTTTVAALSVPGAQPQTVAAIEAAAPPVTWVGPPATLPSSSALECRAGANGGATDVGVTAEEIRIAMTETMEFPVRYVTATAYTSVDRLFDYVNIQGGICGRMLKLRMANEAWRPFPWEAGNDVVASIAGPLDTGVNPHVLNGDVDRAGVPLVGTDGLTAAHHRSPWVWPIGPSTASFTRIAVEHAYDKDDAHTFALVYDKSGPVGTQAAAAFEKHVKKLGGVVRTMQALDSAAADYTAEADRFDLDCAAAGCDFVLLALYPETAKKWVAQRPTMGAKRSAALPLLLDTPFWRECPKYLEHGPGGIGGGSLCKDFHVWAAYPQFDFTYWTGPVGLCRYVEANPATALANLSACTIIQALRQVGPNVTRERLREAIDDVAYQSGLVGPFRDGRRTPDRQAGQLLATAWHPKYDMLTGGFERLEDALTGAVRDSAPWDTPEG